MSDDDTSPDAGTDDGHEFEFVLDEDGHIIEDAPADAAAPDEDSEPEAEPEPELGLELEPAIGPAAKHGPSSPGRATPARGGSGARPATSNPHRYGTSGGGGGGGGSRGGGGGSTGKGNSFSLFNFNLGSIFRVGNILSGSKTRNTTGIAIAAGRASRPAPRRRPASARTSGARSVLAGRPAWNRGRQ